MQKITEYKIITSKVPNDLVAEINEMIKVGWIPTGGVFISQGPFRKEGEFMVNETFTHQAMVKLLVY